MNKADLIDAVANQTGETKTTVEKVINGMDVVINSNLRDGGEVTLPGIGKLKVSHTKARTGRNPSTGQAIDIPAKNRAVFVAAKALKDAINV